MIEILLKNKNLVLIYKPPGIAVQKDTSGDDDAMTLTSRELDALGEQSALWLVHRLDRVVGGLVVFARNKFAAAYLSELVSADGMQKEYLAVVEGRAEGGEMRDYIYKDSASGKAFVVKNGRKGAKEALLEYIPISTVETERGERTLVRIKLHTGRFHQIRVQFASRKMPLVGDGKYGSKDNGAKMPSLFSTRLAFKTKNERIDVSRLPNTDAYPWSLFDGECYK